MAKQANFSLLFLTSCSEWNEGKERVIGNFSLSSPLPWFEITFVPVPEQGFFAQGFRGRKAGAPVEWMVGQTRDAMSNLCPRLQGGPTGIYTRIQIC